MRMYVQSRTLGRPTDAGLCRQIDDASFAHGSRALPHVKFGRMAPQPWSKRASLGLLATATATLGCAGLGEYVWADALPETPTNVADEYRLAPGDMISVRVFNQESMSGRARIRPDGRVTIPFVNDIPAAGHTTQDLARNIQDQLHARQPERPLPPSDRRRRPCAVASRVRDDDAGHRGPCRGSPDRRVRPHRGARRNERRRRGPELGGYLPRCAGAHLERRRGIAL